MVMQIPILYLKIVLYIIHINDGHIDTAENRDIIKPMYNLIEYSDNYSDTSESLWQFERDGALTNNDGYFVNVTEIIHHLLNTNGSLKKTSAVDNNGVFTNVK